MRSKTATLTKPAIAIRTSEPSPTKASNVAEPSRDGRLVVSKEAIRMLAYRKWEAAGRPSGDGVNFWLQAERELAQAHWAWQEP
jgi:hypothetical protein